jgi:branched-chain amino acid transport system permease protein
MGNVWGVLVGALFLAWFNSTGLKQIGVTINEVAGTDFDFTTLTFLIFGMALILMMLFRREGFFPEARTKAIMQEPERSELESHGAQAEYAEAEEHVHAPSEEQ